MPLETLSLQSENVLLLDQQTDILIWEGKSAGDQSSLLVQAARELALERSNNRFPRPCVLSFKEKSSMARWLLCRLIPSHQDSKESISRTFPEVIHFHFFFLFNSPKALSQVHSMTELQFKRFCGQFLQTDDFSFDQYCAALTQ